MCRSIRDETPVKASFSPVRVSDICTPFLIITTSRLCNRAPCRVHTDFVRILQYLNYSKSKTFLCFLKLNSRL